MKPVKYYVLINLAEPTFLSNGDGVPVGFQNVQAASRAGAEHPPCARVGFTIMHWDAHQGGHGAISIESWSADAVRDGRAARHACE